MRLSGVAQAQESALDVGLRQHMLKVYNYMTSGLLLTGIVAYAGVQIPALLNLMYAAGPGGALQPTMFAYIVMFSPLAFILVLNFGIQRMQASTAQLVFWAFAAIMGLSMTHLFLVYTGTSITRVFFITAATFASMSLYGYTTKRDLSKFGSFLMMGLIGIIIASVINIFMQSSAMQFVISVVGVLVFVGLTAHDTQNIKRMYVEGEHSETASKKAIMGALSLYLDFLNLFIMLMHLLGDRR
ncbi:MAG: Bax inhibitor-1/YccA family protein [Rhodospirillaceae bacterium]|nr:Bax inhibitor-1/YccA family protein [Rhodospirillaceae bacterium]MBT4588409.1 Bax inhibitor-1/YccA family protein [Rhodospirillaceae bacterium]MBT4939166.1 Bax inhibitor-1/YccA family protein [Rhodospirillaceae bacterium]MBT7267586.1 Bax inhibitor-1/YccA family protein [Rhodospirillaceae bacterium]